MANIMDFAERMAYYEKRHMFVEADCRNLERKYKANDDSANGFFVAIRKQEHWNGQNFEEIARKLLKINPGKICQYVILRSVDCSEEMREAVFNPEMYSNNELEEIARVANSNAVLRKIFEYVKENMGVVDGSIILCKMATNPVAETKLFDELYEYDFGVANQIFLNIGCNASTGLLMKMFYRSNVKWLNMGHLMQFNREEIYEELANWSQMTPGLICDFLSYSYRTGKVDYKWVKLVEDKMIAATDYSKITEVELKAIIAGTHNLELIDKIMKYLDIPTV